MFEATFTILNPEYGTIVKTIEALGFNTFFRPYEGKEWLNEQFPILAKRLIVKDIFVLSFEDEINDINIWNEIDDWVRVKILHECDKNVEEIDKLIERPKSQKKEYTPDGNLITFEGKPAYCQSIPPQVIDLKNGYEFKCFYDNDTDTKYYEICAPLRELPFTVVVPNFCRKSDVYLFSDIYGSNAWDCNRLECKYDFSFLTQLWKHLGLAGEFNIDVVKRRVDSCYPERCGGVDKLEAEPIVYRKSLDLVLGNSKKRLLDSEFIANKH